MKFRYDDIVTNLRKMLASQRSIFADRYETLRINKGGDEDFEMFVSRFKLSLHKFQFANPHEEQFKCLIFLIALK